MLQLPAIRELAHYLLDYKKCRFAGAELALDSDFYHVPEHPDGKSLDDVFNELENPKSWIALYNIETHPDYQAFLNDVIADVLPRVEKEQGKIFAVQGFMFISSPPSFTPFHIDRENNFWIQLRGRKIMTVFDNSDRDLVSADALEGFVLRRSLRGVRLQEDAVAKGHRFDVGPGDGVYFPSTSPHMTESTSDWVEPGNAVSISLGVVFYTEFTRRQARNHHANHLLKKLGLHPGPVPVRPPLSHWKSALGYCYGMARSLLTSYKPPPGSL